MKKLRLFLLFFLCLNASLSAKNKPAATGNTVMGMQKFEGLFTFYYDDKNDKIFLLIDTLNQEFLYINWLAAGVGSNDIGLDRGQLGGQRIVKFTRSGNKILLLQPNLQYRALTTNQDEKTSVEEAFAQSILWGFTVFSESSEGILIDATDFLLHDAHRVSQTLQNTGQGNYTIDFSRSALYLPQTKAFPKNVEFEATLTFTGHPQHTYIHSVTPTPEAVTVRQHHSFVALPDPHYKPRAFDPRAGFAYISFADYASPFTEPITKRYIERHRLNKKNPELPRSEATEPIVYYLDPGVPEPIRQALLDGALWWNEAFTAAGYQNAFQVKMLPDTADPLDVRYNMIQWVHRSTRGWSYGASVTDPRTGEILKGHVSLGSLRIRQDYLIAAALLNPYGGIDVPETMKEMALARIRQLSAHEVGHTLGLNHNYFASTQNRASVMDYPHPYVKLENGALDFSDAYDQKIGAWDEAAILYGYQDFVAGTDEKSALAAILEETYTKKGLGFLTDEDARPTGSAHPDVHLWDNGADATAELLRVLEVREFALAHFNENSIALGQPMATLEESLVPVYFYHRYQTEAAAKIIGGLYYTYAMRGDGQIPTKLVPPEVQKNALKALLKTIDPKSLALNEELLQLLPPVPFGYKRTREHFKSRTGLAFDAISGAEAAANSTVSLLLHPERATRLVEYHARFADQPSFEFVLDELLNASFKSKPQTGYLGEIRHAVNGVVLENLLGFVAENAASNQAQAIAYLALMNLKTWAAKQANATADASEKAALLYTVFAIEQFEKNPETFLRSPKLAMPDGAPIGCD